MISFLIVSFFVVGFCILAIWIAKTVFFMSLIFFSFLAVLFLLKSIILRNKGNKRDKILNILTTKEVFEELKENEQQYLMKYVDAYKNGVSVQEPTFMSDAKWAALGYTTATLGFDKIVRYGFGYVILRDFLKNYLHGYDDRKKDGKGIARNKKNL